MRARMVSASTVGLAGITTVSLVGNFLGAFFWPSALPVEVAPASGWTDAASSDFGLAQRCLDRLDAVVEREWSLHLRLAIGVGALGWALACAVGSCSYCFCAGRRPAPAQAQPALPLVRGRELVDEDFATYQPRRP